MIDKFIINTWRAGTRVKQSVITGPREGYERAENASKNGLHATVVDLRTNKVIYKVRATETMTKTTDATKRDYLVVWCPPNKGAAQTYREGCGHLARRCDNRAQAERIAHTLNDETRGYLGHYGVIAE